MKIDLHCHTKKIKKGDPITRNVSSDVFSEKIQNADVKIVAITNHNAFDLQQYNELKDTGFLEYAHSHLLLKKSTKKILDEIKKKPFYSDRNIGELEGKGQIFVRSLYRMLCTDSRTAEFKIGITTLKNIKSMIEEINRKYYSAEIASCIGQITEMIEESGVSTIESFIGLSKSIVDCHGMTYEPLSAFLSSSKVPSISSTGVIWSPVSASFPCASLRSFAIFTISFPRRLLK